MSYRRAIPAATPAICRSSRGRAGRVSHMSRSVPRTSVVFMEASLQRSRVGSIRDVPENPPSFPDVTRARRCHDGRRDHSDHSTTRCACAAAASWRAWPVASPRTSACRCSGCGPRSSCSRASAGPACSPTACCGSSCRRRPPTSSGTSRGPSASRRSGSRRWASPSASRAARRATRSSGGSSDRSAWPRSAPPSSGGRPTRPSASGGPKAPAPGCPAGRRCGG